MSFWPLTILFNKSEKLQNGLIENRRHNRFPLKNYPFFRINFSSGLDLAIYDISYGGLALEPSDNLDSEKEYEVSLEIVGSSCPVSLSIIHHTKSFTGCKFHHHHHESLIFLQSFIESFRQGYSALEIKTDPDGEKSNEDKWRVFRGDGPVDLRFRGPNPNAVHALDLVFRVGEKYYQLHWIKSSGARLFETEDPTGESSRMHEVQNSTAFLKGVYTLLGFAEKFPKAKVKSIILEDLVVKLDQTA